LNIIIGVGGKEVNGKKALLPFLILMLIIPAPLTLVEVKADSNNLMVLPGLVTLYSPVNTTYYSNFLSLNLSYGWGAGMQCKLNYSIDGQFGGPIPLTYNDSAAPVFQMIASETGYVQLPELQNGSHKLTISVEADLDDYHGANPPGAPFKQAAPGSANWVASWVDTVDFTVNSIVSMQSVSTSNLTNTVPPIISNLSIENTTYNSTDIPLNFTVNTNTLKATYSLDGKDNVTVAGNSTLTNVPVGTHTLVIYAFDDAGNNAASKTVNFAVAIFASLTPDRHPQPLPIVTIIAVLVAFTVGAVLTFCLFRKPKR
jgi:hypothetical protein